MAALFFPSEYSRNGASTVWRYGEERAYQLEPRPPPKRTTTNGQPLQAAEEGGCCSRPRLSVSTAVPPVGQSCAASPQRGYNHRPWLVLRLAGICLIRSFVPEMRADKVQLLDALPPNRAGFSPNRTSCCRFSLQISPTSASPLLPTPRTNPCLASRERTTLRWLSRLTTLNDHNACPPCLFDTRPRGRAVSSPGSYIHPPFPGRNLEG